MIRRLQLVRVAALVCSVTAQAQELNASVEKIAEPELALQAKRLDELVVVPHCAACER